MTGRISPAGPLAVRSYPCETGTQVMILTIDWSPQAVAGG
jgi:hypothetical protein